jgi:hypothetical protein
MEGGRERGRCDLGPERSGFFESKLYHSKIGLKY